MGEEEEEKEERKREEEEEEAPNKGVLNRVDQVIKKL